MLFTTWAFLAFFLVVVLALFCLPSRSYRQVFLLFASMFFYAYWKSSYLLIILVPAVGDYYLGILIEACDQPERRRLWLFASFVLNLGLLGYFKYSNFFLASIAHGMRVNVQPLSIVLPLGISFFTFKSLSYTVDIYRGQIKACRTLWQYAMYIMYFPEMIAGPIVRASIFLPQMRRSLRPSLGRTVSGIKRIFLGLTKKMVCADRLAIFVDPIFNAPMNYSPDTVTCALLGYSIQIYCDFSGYTDMAIGLSQIIGFDLPENFDFPYLATSISDFWRRWHITLSEWLRDYLYIPLGGNRKGRARTMANLILTMLLGGLWHGANWRFVFWGLLHAAYLIVHKAWKDCGYSIADTIAGRLLAWGLTFGSVSVAWIFFRAPDLHIACIIILKLSGFLAGGYRWIYGPFYLVTLAVGGAHLWRAPSMDRSSRVIPLPQNPLIASFLLTLWLLGIFLFAVVKGSPFIYFQF